VNHDVVAPGELDAVERADISGLRRGDAGSFGGRGRAAPDDLQLVQQSNGHSTEEKRENRNERPARAVRVSREMRRCRGESHEAGPPFSRAAEAPFLHAVRRTTLSRRYGWFCAFVELPYRFVQRGRTHRENARNRVWQYRKPTPFDETAAHPAPENTLR
jgi:hypothetical protein